MFCPLFLWPTLFRLLPSLHCHDLRILGWMCLCLTPEPWALPYPQSQFCCNYHLHADAPMDIFSPDLSKSSRLMYLTAHLTCSSGDINLLWSKQSLWSPPSLPHLKSNPLPVFPSQYMALPFTHLLRPKSQESSLILCLPTLPFFPAGPVNSISNILTPLPPLLCKPPLSVPELFQWPPNKSPSILFSLPAAHFLHNGQKGF